MGLCGSKMPETEPKPTGEVSAEEPQQQATEATKGPPSSYASAAHRAIQPEDSYNKR